MTCPIQSHYLTNPTPSARGQSKYVFLWSSSETSFLLHEIDELVTKCYNSTCVRETYKSHKNLNEKLINDVTQHYTSNASLKTHPPLLHLK